MHASLLHRRAADKNAAWGIVLAIGLSAFVGLMYVIALMFCIQVGLFTSLYALHALYLLWFSHWCSHC